MFSLALCIFSNFPLHAKTGVKMAGCLLLFPVSANSHTAAAVHVSMITVSMITAAGHLGQHAAAVQEGMAET